MRGLVLRTRRRRGGCCEAGCEIRMFIRPAFSGMKMALPDGKEFQPGALEESSLSAQPG